MPVNVSPRGHRSLGVASALALITLAGTAKAQQAGDAAAAQALFDDAKQLMAQGAFDKACPKFAESQRLDPGLGTMLRLADCYAKSGKLASAHALFVEAETLANKSKDPRATVARDEAAKLSPRLSKLTIEVPDSALAPDLEIKQDGAIVPRAQWNAASPADSGLRHIVASAPGKQTWESDVSVPPGGGAATIKIPALEPAPAEKHASSTHLDVDENRGSAQRIAGLALGGVGLLAVGAGGYFGLQSFSQNDDSKAECTPGPSGKDLCTQAGLDARDDARTSATIANITMIAGGALIVGGAILFLTAPSAAEKQSRAPVRLTPGGIAGTF